MITSKEHRYADRPTRFVGVSTPRGWTLKNYEITLDGVSVAPEVWVAAEAAVERHVAGSGLEPWLGFVTVHAAKDAVWLLIDLWQDDLLYHALYRAGLESPGAFTRVSPDGPTACVWELRVLAHERAAYLSAADESERDARVAAYTGYTVTVPARGTGERGH